MFDTDEPDVDSQLDAGTDGFDSLEGEYDKLLGGEGDTITIPKAQLQRYAQEHKAYRQKWGEVARTFQGFDAEQVQTFGAFLGAVNSGDSNQVMQAVEWMRGQLEGLTPAQKREAIAEIKDQAKDAGMTQAEANQVAKALKEEDVASIVEKRLKEALAERDRESQIQKTVEEIKGHAARLADQHGLPDFNQPGPIYDVLLSTAQRLQQAERGLSLTDAMNKAAESILERINNAGQQLMSKKVAGAPRSTPSPKGGVEPSGQRGPRTLKDAAEAAARRFESMNGR